MFITWSNNHENVPGFNFNQFGYLGVDLFFVISGFCLAWPYYSDPSKIFSLRRYCKARFWRIYPPYATVFLLLLCSGYIFRRSGNESLVVVEFAEPIGIRYALEGLVLYTAKLATPFWTLVLEARWYVAFVAMLFVSRRFSVWIVLALSVAIGLVQLPLPAALSKLDVYLPAFAAGMASAYLWSRSSQRVYKSLLTCAPLLLLLSIVFAVACVPGWDSKLRGTSAEVLPSCLAFSALLLSLLRYWWIFSSASGIFGFIGIFSYSVYLIHEPLIQLIKNVVPISSLSRGPAVVAWYVVVPASILFFSYLVYLVVEKPFLERRSWLPLSWFRRQLGL